MRNTEIDILSFRHCFSSSDAKGHVCYCPNFAFSVCPSLSWLTFHMLMVFSETTGTYKTKLCRNDICDVPQVILSSGLLKRTNLLFTTDTKKKSSYRLHPTENMNEISNSYYNLIEIRLPKKCCSVSLASRAEHIFGSLISRRLYLLLMG